MRISLNNSDNNFFFAWYKQSNHQFMEFDIIFVALARWDGPYSSTAFSIACALSKTHRVFYIENPFTWKDFLLGWRDPLIKKRWRALLFGRRKYTLLEGGQLTIVTPRLVFPINWLPDGKAYRFLLNANNRIFNKAIDATLKEKKVQRYVYFNSFNPFCPLKSKAKPVMRIYQSVDDISQSSYVGKHGPTLESEQVVASDFTITTSGELKRRLQTYAQHVHLVPNAANIRLFKTALDSDVERPAELEGISKKVICYTGNICRRIDYSLLLDIAKAHSDKILLMVGPLGSNDDQLRQLKVLNHVIFTGPKPINVLPAYLRYSDCAIIPFLCNQLTRSIYPLKINEYLAAGKPVVTTGFSEDILNFKDVIYLSENNETFVKNIDRAIGESTAERERQRVEAAEGNTWEARADQILSLVNDHLK